MPKSMTTGELQIPVHDTGRMHGRERRGQASGQPEKGQPSHRPVLGDQFLYRLAGHVPGHYVGRIVIHIGIDDLGHEWAVHPAHRVELAG
jgi:hypothetical protein